MPNYEKTILCLANSRKTSGRCVAGRELVNGVLGAWVRPVSSRPTAEISLNDRRYSNGEDPRLLDVITIQMTEPRSHAYQIENHLIDAGYYWTLQRRATWEEALAAADGQHIALWNNVDSSYNGLHDRVHQSLINPREGSLRLISVPQLQVCVSVEGAEFGNGKRKVRGQFIHLGTQYLLSITDPDIEARYLAKPDGITDLGHALLCISLGDVYEGNAYKLIAAVIQPSD